MQIRHLFLALPFILFFSACQSKPPKGKNGVTYKSPVEYNDYIISRQSQVMKNMVRLTELDATDVDSADRMLDKYVLETGKMITEIRGMPDYNGDTSLRNVAAELFVFYKTVFDKDYRDIIHLRSDQEGTSGDTETAISEILKRLSAEEDRYDSRLQRVQENFAKRNNMKLVENEKQKEYEEKMKDDQ